MLAAIAAVMAVHRDNIAERQRALDNIGLYRSRGKGRAGIQKSRNRAAHVKRAARKARNRMRMKGKR